MRSHQVTTIYDASGRDRLSIQAWRHMVRELVAYRELTARLVFRNFSAQFRQSVLGYLWVVLPPVATTVVFTMLKKANIVSVPMEGFRMTYTIFVLLGTTVWGLFTQVAMMATGSISAAGSLVSKVYFPREVLVLSAVGNALVNAVIRFAVLVLTFLLLGYLPCWPSILSPLLLIPLVFLALGIGLFLAPVNAMMHDTSRALEFFFQFGMFLAPTIYPTPSLETAATGWQIALFWLHSLNPVSHILYAFTSLLDHGTFAWTAGLQVSMALSLLVFFMGWRFFHICEPMLAERL